MKRYTLAVVVLLVFAIGLAGGQALAGGLSFADDELETIIHAFDALTLLYVQSSDGSALACATALGQENMDTDTFIALAEYAPGIEKALKEGGNVQIIRMLSLAEEPVITDVIGMYTSTHPDALCVLLKTGGPVSGCVSPAQVSLFGETAPAEVLALYLNLQADNPKSAALLSSAGADLSDSRLIAAQGPAFDMPASAIAKGAPVITRRGQLVGITVQLQRTDEGLTATVLSLEEMDRTMTGQLRLGAGRAEP